MIESIGTIETMLPYIHISSYKFSRSYFKIETTMKWTDALFLSQPKNLILINICKELEISFDLVVMVPIYDIRAVFLIQEFLV